MRSQFLGRMESYQGDLDDIIRATVGGGAGRNSSSSLLAVSDWQFPSNPLNYSSGVEGIYDDFGHPFFNDLLTPASGLFSTANNLTDIGKRSVEDTGNVEFGGGGGGGRGGGGGSGGGGESILGNEEVDDGMKRVRPPNMFSRMLQISPNEKSPVYVSNSPVVAAASPGRLKAAGSLLSDDIIYPNSSKSCLVESPGSQISSPRNTGNKRRKSQAKKVVCIPAPAPANSRPAGGGEVVPSDLWAWRKYGQKPIKGSPYPRGYYRCSSSKGCSARKQVERSRADPNMLVITYTSEHNHPWPTQRNALAGSTRSQPSKNSSNSKSSQNSQSQKSTNPKEIENNPNNVANSTQYPEVKEENEDLDYNQLELDEGFHQSYQSALLDSNHSEDMFADLGEIEADPLDLLFTEGFSGENKALDPYNFYDWTGNNINNNNSSKT